MCHFPNINYARDMPELHGGNDAPLPRRVRAMRTMLINKHLIADDFVDVNTSMTNLEERIFQSVDEYCDNQQIETLRDVFYLIQIWGGQSGRGIFLKQQFEWALFSPIYRVLVEAIRNVNEITDDSCWYVRNIVQNFINDLHGIGYRGMNVAFITKHVHFWMHHNLPDDMLPIYDRTFAENITGEGHYATIRYLLPFWNAMRSEAQIHGVGLANLERQLFNLFN